MRVLSRAESKVGSSKVRSAEVIKSRTKESKKFGMITFEYLSPSKVQRNRAAQVMVPFRTKTVRRLDDDDNGGDVHFDDDYQRINEEDARGRSEKAAVWVSKHEGLFLKSAHPYEESLKKEKAKNAKVRGH